MPDAFSFSANLGRIPVGVNAPNTRPSGPTPCFSKTKTSCIFFGKIQIRHHGHSFQTRNRIARAVGVHRRQRAVMTGIHGLQHIQSFLAANLADDNAVGAHPQRVDQELPLHHRALALNVRGPALQTDHVALLHLQFGRVFDGHNSFFVGDVSRQHVQEGRFSGAVRPKSQCSGGLGRRL